MGIKTIDDAFLLDPFKVKVVEDDPEFGYWVSGLERSSSFVEGLGIDWKVIDACREMNRIPAVLTQYSCVGKQVHALRNELLMGKPQGLKPHIQFSVIGETGMAVSREALERFEDLPHRVYFKRLSEAVNEAGIPFEFNGYDMRDRESTRPFRGNSPRMEINVDCSAGDVVVAWDFVTEFTKKFSKENGLDSLVWLPKGLRGSNNPFNYLKKRTNSVL